MKRFKKILLFVASLVFIAICILWYANRQVEVISAGKTFSDITQVPAMKTGLLLGTSKYLKSGHVNRYFAHRIEAASELLNAGKIRYIIISGDNGRSS